MDSAKGKPWGSEETGGKKPEETWTPTTETKMKMTLSYFFIIQPISQNPKMGHPEEVKVCIPMDGHLGLYVGGEGLRTLKTTDRNVV